MAPKHNTGDIQAPVVIPDPISLPITLSHAQLRSLTLALIVAKQKSQCQKRPKLRKSGQKWPKIQKNKQKYTWVATNGQKAKDIKGKMWPEVARSSQMWPKFPGKPSHNPSRFSQAQPRNLTYKGPQSQSRPVAGTAASFELVKSGKLFQATKHL